MYVSVTWNELRFKGIVQHFGKYAYSRSCGELHEKIDTTLISLEKYVAAAASR